MNDFVEFPTSFPDAVAIICESLSLSDIKSLSLVSLEWFDATSGILSDRSVFHPSDTEYLKNFKRNFKNFTVSNGTTNDIDLFLDNLIELLRRKRKMEEESQTKYKKYKIESLKFEGISLNSSNISKLSQLQAVTTLEFIWCTFEVNQHEQIEEDLSSLNLKDMKIDLDKEIDLTYVLKILQDNKNSIKTFHFTTSKLYKCFLSGSFLSTESARTIKEHCPNLEELTLERATTSQIDHIKELKSLKRLSVSGPEIHTLNFGDLKLNKLSVHIHNSGRINVTVSDFTVLLAGLPNLTEIDFSNSDNIFKKVKVEIISLLSNNCPLLVKIDLSGNRSLNEKKKIEVKQFKNLKILNFYNTGLKEQILDLIVCPKLQELNLGETDISPNSFKNFISKTPLLKVLKCRGLQKFTDKEVFFLGESLKYLRNLELQDCSKLTLKSLEFLIKEQFISDITISISQTPNLEDVLKLKEGFYQKMNYFNTLLLSNGYRNIWVFIIDNNKFKWVDYKFPRTVL
uniref:F-box domain-containing protein n=1 Tax=Megaselia scalaris TaxID=36166 RepID=T1GVC9_MEGSC